MFNETSHSMEKKRVRIPKDQMETRNEIIVRLYKQGMTPKGIAKALQPLYPNLSNSTVGAILAKLGIPAHNPNRSAGAKKAAEARWSKKAEKEDQMEMDTEATETTEAAEQSETETKIRTGRFTFLMVKCITGGDVAGYKITEGNIYAALVLDKGFGVQCAKKGGDPVSFPCVVSADEPSIIESERWGLKFIPYNPIEDLMEYCKEAKK